MARSLLTTASLAAMTLASLAGCSGYAPKLVDCAVHCGAGDACPSGTSCRDGFCRLPGTDGVACDCKLGDQRTCGGGKGVCVPGVQTCTSAGTWSTTCLGEGKPSAEVCDGLDNDCDGVVDDDVTDAPSCGVDAGVCASARRSCVDGGFLACTTASFGPDYEAIETRCDGKDNDCDGLTDETAAGLLASDALFPSWLFSYPEGFALAYAADAGNGQPQRVVVSRYDARLAPVGSLEVASSLPDPTLAAAAVGSTVYLVWHSQGRVLATRVTMDGGVTPMGGLSDAGFDSVLSVGANEQRLLAGYITTGGIGRVLEWNLQNADNVTARDLNVSGGVVTTASLWDLNVERSGQYVYVEESHADDAGSTINDFPLYSTTTWTDVGANTYVPPGAVLVMRGSALTSTAWDTDYWSYSGEYHVTDLLARVPERVRITESGDWTEYWTVDALTTDGGTVVAFYDYTGNQIVLGTSYRLSNNTVFRLKPLGQSAGFGHPRLSRAAPDGMMGLSWIYGGDVSGRLVCAP